MLGGETKLGMRLACLAGLSGRAGASIEVGLPREISAPHPKIEKTLCLPKNSLLCANVRILLAFGSDIQYGDSEEIRASRNKAKTVRKRIF
jgi:hypothetical protein